MDKRLDEIIDGIKREVDYAVTMYPAFNSAHEGFSVMNEEVDELWDHVKVKQGRRNVAEMKKEALQVAAMAIRFAYDICATDEAGQK